MSPPPSSTYGEAHWSTLKEFLKYLWPDDNKSIKIKVTISLLCLVFAKLFHVTVPIIYKQIVDFFTPHEVSITLYMPIGLILAYGFARLSTSLFSEIRDIIFAYVTQSVIRLIGLKTFKHLHDLSLRFHLDRRTGALNRAIERGTKGIEWLLFFSVFNLIPTLIEILFVAGIITIFYGFAFSILIIVPLFLYIFLTIFITEWRNRYRREMNKEESEANAHAIDSLLNYETVKYFGNEENERKRFDSSLKKYQKVAILSQNSLSLLNVTQSIIIAIGFILTMLFASQRLIDKSMSLGDFVLINTYLFQLYIPLNFLGTVYRTIKQSLVDLEEMVSLQKIPLEIQDKENSTDLQIKGGTISFHHVSFYYMKERPILKDIHFTLPSGQNYALVGPSGAGKSTISRLLFRFYDVTEGNILIDNQDIRDVTQKSLRTSIGIVPQDTVLFNDTIFYNIAYGNLEASAAEVKRAAQLAHIDRFIDSLPEGYQTKVGERGLKLSGGEKQRVAIARVILKKPSILIFDEATSALDSKTEKEIQKNLKEVSKGITTLIIAHRLSTIVDADQIMVLDQGRIVEVGRHKDLLDKKGLYAAMWSRQQETEELREALQKAEIKEEALE